MLQFLPAPILGAVMMALFTLNTLFWSSLVYLAVLVKLLSPRRSGLYDRASRLAAWFAQIWAAFNVRLCDTAFRWDWQIRIDANLNPHGQYLVCSNHQSWNDIFVAMKTFGRKAPFFKFFLKQELMWVPVLNLCWWGLDFPFMKRYSREQIEKDPSLRGKDLETTRKACERFRHQPVLVMNYLEGTRFTPQKHARQASPFRHLLKPKSGGFAFALGAMGEQLNSLLDVTIVYPDGPQGFWAFLCGRVRSVIVEVRQLTVPAELFQGSYENDPAFRAKFQTWIAELWRFKDQRIGAIRAEAGLPPA